jgi:hypothetical protein
LIGQVVGGSKRRLGDLIEAGQLSPSSAIWLVHVDAVNGKIVDWTIPENVMMALTVIDSESNAKMFARSQVNECLHSLLSALESMDPIKIRQHIATYAPMIHRPDILTNLSSELLLAAAYAEMYSIDSFLDHQYVDERYPLPNSI